MNREQTRQLLRPLAAAYAAHVDDDVIAVWHAQMDRIDFDAAMATAMEWVNDEPRFPRISEFKERIVERGRRQSARRMIANAPCSPECSSGWIPVETIGPDGRQVSMRPCERCRPETYALWKAGHFAPGHECPDCDARAKTKIHRART